MASKKSNSILKGRGEEGLLLMELALWLSAIVLLLSGVITIGSLILRDIRIADSLRRSGLRISRLEAPPGSKLADSDYYRCNEYGEIITQELKRADLNPDEFIISAELGQPISDEDLPSQVISIVENREKKRPIRDLLSAKTYSVSLVTLAIGQPFSCKEIFDRGGKL